MHFFVDSVEVVIEALQFVVNVNTKDCEMICPCQAQIFTHSSHLNVAQWYNFVLETLHFKPEIFKKSFSMLTQLRRLVSVLSIKRVQSSAKPEAVSSS